MAAKSSGCLLALAGTVLAGLRDCSVPRRSGRRDGAVLAVRRGRRSFCAILMITNRNPVYSALWFALVTLNVCGLFLLQFAPFLAAATVIVYAGAIVVTFVFVIMLAQQSGATVYDQRSRQPRRCDDRGVRVVGDDCRRRCESCEDRDALATMRRQLMSQRPTARDRASQPSAAGQRVRQPIRSAVPNRAESLGRCTRLGRSLFGDYLFAVELAGTLLLVATIGAIAIAPRRRRGTL